MMDFMRGKKTFISAGLMFLHALMGLVMGDMNMVEFMNSPQLWEMLNASGLASLRAGMMGKPKRKK